LPARAPAIFASSRRNFLARFLWHAARIVLAFFGIIVQTLREVLGADWSDDIDAAWRQLLGEIESLVAPQ
jgi:hypothetical protein